MKRLLLALTAFLAFGALTVGAPIAAQITAVPNSMTFQGRLAKPDGIPIADGTYSIRFSLHDALNGGMEKWNQTVSPVTVKNGTFAALLSGFPAGTFQTDLWLEIKIGTSAPLTPRQPLVSVAYAMKADSVKDGAITSASIADGTITAADMAAGGFNTLAWLLGGNSGTNPASHFLGTTDAQPLVLKANNQRALQMQYVQNGNYEGHNLLGGYWLNSIREGVTGATVFGGIKYFGANYSNQVTDHGGTVSGGAKNQAGNNNADITDGLYATVGGGYDNIASSLYATIGGGFQNRASDTYATVGGGRENIADGNYATVAGGFGSAAFGIGATSGGGFFNRALGDYSTTPGGWYSIAYAPYSFAAGRRAKARHDGAFVWGDSTDADMDSTGPNQFIIRAAGGVGINTNAPSAQLEVNGGSATALVVRNVNDSPWAIRIHNDTQPTFQTGMYVTNDGFFRITSRVVGGGYAQLNSNGTWSSSSDRRLKTDIQPLTGLLDKALALRPVSYYFKQQDRVQSPHRQMGFIAQEVEELFPALVEGNDSKTLNYAGLSVVAIGALQEQQKQMEALKKDNDATKKENAELKARLEALEAALTELKANRK